MKMMDQGYNNYENSYEAEDQEEDENSQQQVTKKSNSLPIWRNQKTMNLNNLVLTNIQSSQYFKVRLYELKTYHEVIDEIYHQVSHLEPWEKGSRKTSGQTGMCGGVRGVGAGGIVSTAYCILYKLFTLRLTRKQLTGLINHADSPYIRGLGFMYIRYTQPPENLWEWFEPYLDDEEKVDVRAGGGQVMTIGAMVRHFLTKLDWHSTLFPRIPVPIQKQIDKQMSERDNEMQEQARRERQQQMKIEELRRHGCASNGRSGSREAHDNRGGGRDSRDRRDARSSRDRSSRTRDHSSRDRDNRHRDRSSRDRGDRDRSSRDRGDRDRSSRDRRDRDRGNRDNRSRERRDDDRRSRDVDYGRERTEHSRRERRDDHRHASRRDHHRYDREERRHKSRSRSPRKDYSDELQREKERLQSSRHRSRSRDRERRHHR